MNRRRIIAAGLLVFAAIRLPVGGAQVFFPVPGLVDESTGLMESFTAGDWYRGSAVVTRDPKLIYSCAHLFFEQGKWATDYLFHRAYHDKFYPAEANGASPRGLHHFTSYSSGVNSQGSESNAAFASDFTVLYGNSEFGPAAGWWPKGGPVLRSTRLKRVVGYPSSIDYTGEPGRCYQHATGWFDYQAYKILNSYHEIDDVSTGSGNSGGPVFVQDDSGDSYLAGILVSGTRRTGGVVALDLSTDTMAGYALGLQDKTRTFSNSMPSRLPDGGKAFTSIPIHVSGFTGSIARLKLSLSMTTSRRGDLDVFLRSPTGRIRWISKRAGGSADNLEIDAMNLSNTYRGYEANGIWELRIRDAVSGARATFQSLSLTVSAL